MFSLKTCRCWSRCLAVGRVSKRIARTPGQWSAAGAVVRRPYGDDHKFVESDKYKVFRDDDSSVILDVEEERALLDALPEDQRPGADDNDQFAGLNTSRGVSGVFEVEHLVEALHKNSSSDVFVATVPSNVRYVDYIVIASGKSPKHLKSIADFIHKLYKVKRRPTDGIPRIVNKKPLDWIALDIGNIALHLLTNGTRSHFDLETIWSVGEEFDSHLNSPTDSLVTLLNENSFSLDNLEPVDNKNTEVQ